MVGSHIISGHLCFQVVKRPKDFFKGIKAILKEYNNVVFEEIILSDNFYEIVDDAEYAKVLFYQKASELKILKRVRNYSKVFREFERIVKLFIENNKEIKHHYFYFADEGVWGEFAKVLKRKIEKKYYVTVTIVNIQHGFFSLNDMGAKKARKIGNALFKTIFKYPFLGNGFGGSTLDTYLVYGELEKKLIEQRSPLSKVFVSPVLCKYEMLERICEKQKQLNKIDGIEKKILFAAQLNEIGHDCLLTEEQITEKIAPLFATLKKLGYTVYYRFHPAITDKSAFLKLLNKYGITDNVIFDDEIDVSDSILKVSAVLALQSTVLYDGFIVGRMPIIVRGLLKPYIFTTPHEEIDINQNLVEQIVTAFNKLSIYHKSKINISLEPEVSKYFKQITSNNY